MAQDNSICLTTTDAVLPGVLGLLPQGDAWTAAQADGTVHNSFWRAISSVVAFVNKRLCDYIDELYCSTAKESVDQWQAEYSFDPNDDCNVYANLCAKIVAKGGQSCSYFTEIAAALGWSITCEDMSDQQTRLPIAGCVRAGCMQLGPPSVPLTTPCFVDTSAVPPAAPTPSDTVFVYPRPVAPTPLYGDICLSDTSGYFQAYTGFAHVWKVIVNLSASTNIRKNLVFSHPDLMAMAGVIQAGCFRAGNLSYKSVLCFLETIKPAHTTLIYDVVNG